MKIRLGNIHPGKSIAIFYMVLYSFLIVLTIVVFALRCTFEVAHFKGVSFYTCLIFFNSIQFSFEIWMAVRLLFSFRKGQRHLYADWRSYRLLCCGITTFFGITEIVLCVISHFEVRYMYYFARDFHLGDTAKILLVTVIILDVLVSVPLAILFVILLDKNTKPKPKGILRGVGQAESNFSCDESNNEAQSKAEITPGPVPSGLGQPQKRKTLIPMPTTANPAATGEGNMGQRKSILAQQGVTPKVTQPAAPGGGNVEKRKSVLAQGQPQQGVTPKVANPAAPGEGNMGKGNPVTGQPQQGVAPKVAVPSAPGAGNIGQRKSIPPPPQDQPLQGVAPKVAAPSAPGAGNIGQRKSIPPQDQPLQGVAPKVADPATPGSVNTENPVTGQPQQGVAPNAAAPSAPGAGNMRKVNPIQGKRRGVPSKTGPPKVSDPAAPGGVNMGENNPAPAGTPQQGVTPKIADPAAPGEG